MPGRGDNNKSGSAGRGASNQSNQGIANTNDANTSKSDKAKGTASMPQEKTSDQSAHRNTSVKKEEK